MREITRRQALALLGGGVPAAGAVYLGVRRSATHEDDIGAGLAYRLGASGYTPDGTAGRTAAYRAVRGAAA